MKKRTGIIVALLCCGMAVSLGGCSSKIKNILAQSNTAVESQSEENESVSSQEEPNRNTEKTGTESSEGVTLKTNDSEHLDSLVGEWKRLVTMEENYYEVTDDIEYAPSIEIYVEDGAYKIDYYDYEYGCCEYYGMKLADVKNPQYTGNDEADWYAEFSRKKAEGTYYNIVFLTKDTLKLHERNAYNYTDPDTGETIESIYNNYYVYVKSDSRNLEEIDEQYRYTSTVTVSNIKELYNAIGSNTHIIMKEGTYNISTLPLSERTNKSVNMLVNADTGDETPYNGDTIMINWVNNLFLEAEEGAEVKICTEDGYEAPLAFRNCTDIVIKNLTLGHEVDPGFCSGAVLLMEDSAKVSVSGCRLYGSGTYGIEASGTYDVNVEDTDIYECTYGLVFVTNGGNFNFKNCVMRDSSGYNMISLYNTWSILFEDCIIKNNTVGLNDNYLVDADNGTVNFVNCRFSGNEYSNMTNGDVVFEGCSIED